MKKNKSKKPEPGAIKLPRSVGQQRLREHPMFLAREKATLKEIAYRIGITHNSIITAENRAREDRDYPIPARWVRAYSQTTGLPPYAFRPDLYDEGMEFMNE